MADETPVADESNPEVLSLGAVVGGTTRNPRAWGDAISSLGQRIAAIRGTADSPLNVNVVFHVPGEVVSPDWEGVRTGRYDRRTQHLMVQATVPDIPPNDLEPFLIERLQEAIGVAEEFARRKRIAEELPGLWSLLRRL